MSPPSDAGALGRQLQVADFLPLPDVDHRGQLIGTRLWRVRDGYVEYLALYKNGLAHAVRAVAAFDYAHPTDHGRLVGHRFGTAGNALDWLLSTHNVPDPPLVRPYAKPFPPDVWRSPHDQKEKCGDHRTRRLTDDHADALY